jgi:DNA-binding FadR family transcriptional regulator
MKARPSGVGPVTPVRVPKTAEVVANALRRSIVSGEIPEDGALPGESALMERFGVSRPSLREALRILETERLITVRRGARGGARASRPALAVSANYLGLLMLMDGVALADVFQARVAIEPVAVQLLANRGDRAEAVQELKALLADEETELGDGRRYATATTRFHKRLVEVSGNKTLALLWGTLEEVLTGEMLWAASPAPVTPRRRQSRVRAVTRTLDLIAGGHADEAATYWHREMVEASSVVFRRHGATTVASVLG